MRLFSMVLAVLVLFLTSAIQSSADEQHDQGERSGRLETEADLYDDTMIVEVLEPEWSGNEDSNPHAAEQAQTTMPQTVIPVGAGPVGEQVAWPDFRNDLRDCPTGTTRSSAEFSCWDVVNREAYWVWPAPDQGADEDVSDEDAAAGEVVTGGQLVTAVREFTRVRISPAPLVLQPDQNWHLVNLPVIVRTEPAGQQFSTVLLGLPVQIRAEPVSYSWDFGDGSAVVNTTDPGAEYPEQTIEHAYDQPGEYQITLITYWSGAFRVAGGPWIDIDGLGVTATTSPALDLQTRSTSLVG